MNYAFRIHASYQSLKQTISKIAESSEVLVIYEHPEGDSERTHIHGYVESLTVGTDSLKNWIKKELNVTSFPKSDWAFETVISKGIKKGQPVDRDSLIYYHKGKYPILFNKGLTEEFVKEQHSKSYTPTTQYVKKVQYKIVSESKAQAKKRNWDLLEEMKNLYKQLSARVPFVSDEDIISIVIKVLDDNKIITSVYKRMEFFDSLSVNVGRSRVKDDMMAILEKRKSRL